MFKKLVILSVMLFSLFLINQVIASVTDLSQTHNICNTGNDYLTTYVGSTILTPGVHKIVSVSIMPISGNTNPSSLEVYDASTVAQLTLSNMRGEIETVANASGNRYFTYPKVLTNGLAIVQSPRTTVTIDYTR